jgi:glycogen synthase
LKILVLSNLYPPHHRGGYEIGCMRVVDTLRRRGHDIHVLTSTYGIEAAAVVDNVSRHLQEEVTTQNLQRLLPGRILHAAGLHRHNRKVLVQALKQHRPDIVYAWNLQGVSTSLCFEAHALGYPCAYYISDHWPATADSWFRLSRGRGASSLTNRVARLIHPALRLAGLVHRPSIERITHAQFTSRYILNHNEHGAMTCDPGRVIHWGVDAPEAVAAVADRIPNSVLVGGRIDPTKGISVVVEAIASLASDPSAELKHLSLTIAGTLPDDAYGRRIADLANSMAAVADVRLPGRLSTLEIADAMKRHRIFVLPSIWEEPFSIMLVEAMAAGMACIATRTGGTPEIIVDEHSGLLVPPDDATATRQAINRLLLDSNLANRIANNARSQVLERFTLTHMVDQIESHLLDLVNAHAQHSATRG